MFKNVRINANVFNLGLTSLFTDISSEMIVPILPLFLVNVLGASVAFVGLIEGVAETTSSVLKMVSGWLADKLGKRKIMVVLGYTLSAIPKPLLAIVAAPWQVLALRFLDKTGKGIRTSPRDAIVADSVTASEIGRSFGFHRAMDTAGAIIGPLLAFILLPLFKNNYRDVFIFSALPAICAVLILIFFVREKKREARVISTSEPKAKLNAKFIFFIFVFTLFTLGNSSDAFIVLRAQNLSISLVLIPIFWLVMNVFYTFSSVPAGIISDKVGRKKMLILGFLLYSLVYFGFGFANQVWAAWILMAFYGIYYGISDGGARAYIADLTPAEGRATAYGVFHACVGFAALPASVIMGLLWQTVGITFAFSFGAVLALLAAILLLFI